MNTHIHRQRPTETIQPTHTNQYTTRTCSTGGRHPHRNDTLKQVTHTKKEGQLENRMT